MVKREGTRAHARTKIQVTNLRMFLSRYSQYIFCNLRTRDVSVVEWFFSVIYTLQRWNEQMKCLFDETRGHEIRTKDANDWSWAKLSVDPKLFNSELVGFRYSALFYSLVCDFIFLFIILTNKGKSQPSKINNTISQRKIM